MRTLFRKFSKKSARDVITVVSGLPRSGTSMMMKMLEAGGLLPVTDNIRTADKDNPKGYYEYERVKKMPDGDTEWLGKATGKTVKVISALLEHLPSAYTYKVIFMLRDMQEILASQHQMLVRSNKPTDKVSDDDLAEMYRKHLAKVRTWLAEQENISIMYVDYNDIMSNPGSYPERIQRFLGFPLDIEKMKTVVDPNLYRQRRQTN